MPKERPLFCVVSAIALAGTLGGTGCLFEKSPADRAADTERLQCSDFKSPADEAKFVESLQVLFVQPRLMYHMASGVSKVTGTRITVRPPDGVTADRMTRVLQCHGARLLLGHANPALVPHDPYSLPGLWVSIDVKEEEGNYVVIVAADKVPDNLRILHEANEFLAAQRAGVAQPPPAAPSGT